MGKRGPAPTPTALKLVKGVHKHNPDRVNRAEPEPEPGEVRPPGWLSPGGLELWEQYAPDLERQGVLQAWDVEHFALWCDCAAKRRRITAEIDEFGMTLKEPVLDSEGTMVGYVIKRNPATLVEKGLTDSLARYGARFGLTPSDRSQLKVGDGDSKNPKGRLLTS